MDSTINCNNTIYFLEQRFSPGLFTDKALYKTETGEFKIIKQIQPSFLSILRKKSNQIINYMEYYNNLIQNSEIFQGEEKISILSEAGTYVNSIGLFQWISISDYKKYCFKNLLQALPNKRLPEENTKFYFFNILNFCKKMHNENVYFPSLRLEDILLDEEYNIKVSDYSLNNAVMKSADNMNDWLEMLLGKKSMLAPEFMSMYGSSSSNMNSIYFNYVKNSSNVDIMEKANVFNLGCIIFSLLFGTKPFKSNNIVCPVFKLLNSTNTNININITCNTTENSSTSTITTTNNPLFWKAIEKTTKISIQDPNLKNLLERMLLADPSKRPTYKDILEHPYMKNSIIESPSNSNKKKLDVKYTNLDSLIDKEINKNKKSINIGNNGFISNKYHIYRSMQNDEIEKSEMVLNIIEKYANNEFKEYSFMHYNNNSNNNSFNSSNDLFLVVNLEGEDRVDSFIEKVVSIIMEYISNSNSNNISSRVYVTDDFPEIVISTESSTNNNSINGNNLNYSNYSSNSSNNSTSNSHTNINTNTIISFYKLKDINFLNRRR